MKHLPAPRALLSWGGRAVLTVVISVAFLYVITIVSRVHSAYLDSREQRHHPGAVYVATPTPSEGPSSQQSLWPHFPATAGNGTSRTLMLNGVETISEDWTTAAAPVEVLDYYRQQMSARGWRDVTEETYALRPEDRQWGTQQLGVQDDRFIAEYRRVADSTLVVSRGNWSMHLQARPTSGRLSETAVSIMAVATPTLRDFFVKLLPQANERGKTENKPIEAVQFSGNDRYHTTVSRSPLPPLAAFDAALVKARQDGWSATLVTPEGGSAAAAAWLTRGQQYAILSAASTGNGQESSISLMEVTPSGAK